MWHISRRIVLFTAAIVVLAAIGATAAVVPVVTAFACPACYGFERHAPGIYIEKGASAGFVEKFDTGLRRADQRLAAYYPAREARPTYLVCETAQCERRLHAKGAMAVTYGTRIIFVTPDGANETILAHELSHAELHARVGTLAFIRGALPAWFDEGLAVNVSGDERYLVPEAEGTMGCRVPASDDLPTGARDWRRQAGIPGRPLYAQAACRVLDWLKANGGPDAVNPMAARLKAGEPFGG